MSSYETLICRIFEQTIEDYNELKEKNLSKKRDNSCSYSIKDIELFLKSKWCTHLLDMIDSNITGNEILNKIQSQYA